MIQVHKKAVVIRKYYIKQINYEETLNLNMHKYGSFILKLHPLCYVVLTVVPNILSPHILCFDTLSSDLRHIAEVEMDSLTNLQHFSVSNHI